MPFDIGALGQSAAGSIIGAGLGLALEGHEDRRQLAQQTKLTNLQTQAQQGLTEFNMQKQLELWQKTSYPAQVEQLEKAGLNPALIYGGGAGAGGSTAISPGNVSGATAQQGGGNEVSQIAGLGLQAATQTQLIEAQKENIEADTENKKAQNPNFGKEGANLDSDTKLKLAQIKNQDAQTALTQIQTGIAGVQWDWDSATKQDRESIVNMQLSKMIEECKILEAQRTITEGTVKTQIAQAQRNLYNSILDSAIKKAQAANVSQDTINKMMELTKISSDINIDWANQENIHDQLRQKQSEIDWEQSGMPKGVKDLLDHIFIIPGAGGSGITPIKGFHNRN